MSINFTNKVVVCISDQEKIISFVKSKNPKKIYWIGNTNNNPNFRSKNIQYLPDSNCLKILDKTDIVVSDLIFPCINQTRAFKKIIESLVNSNKNNIQVVVLENKKIEKQNDFECELAYKNMLLDWIKGIMKLKESRPVGLIDNQLHSKLLRNSILLSKMEVLV